MNDEQEYGMEDLAEDIEFLRKNNFIEIVGVASNGEWLYALTKEMKERIADSSKEDIWDIITELIFETEINNKDEK
jgi:hypothetical protein